MPGVDRSEIRWQKSSASGPGECIEVALRTGETVLVRDSKDRIGALLSFSRPAWIRFLCGVRMERLAVIGKGPENAAHI
ncbi:MAG: DUF397 domain-containing protein [Dactylosporangium sp.]|nr:DUF397 domain-containing protein [Dactylosporangium sp.]NNJ63777.1 DUF397 domain-containing protein [Dactylosporangium sp.]